MKIFAIILSSLLYVLAFSPFDYKLFIIISLILFLYTIERVPREYKIKYSFLYGFLFHSMGVSWVFYSLKIYGGLDLLWSIILTIIFLLIISLPYLIFGIFHKALYKSDLLTISFIASLFVICEFIKSFLFGGFPWLLVGHSQNSTIFDNIFSVTGAYSVTFIIVFISASACKFILDKKLKETIKPILLIITSFIILQYAHLKNNDIIKPIKRISFIIFQPNIYPDSLYNRAEYVDIKDNYMNFLSEQNDVQLIIMPETILPHIVNSDNKIIDEMRKQSSNKKMIISGFFTQANGNIYNSMSLISKDIKFYNKRKLVPFGEYTPWYDIFLFISNYINFPLSNITPGRENQDSIFFNGTHIIPVICFESNFPNLVESIQTDEIIVNISNDGWFGDSFSQHQHLQINKIRALEFNRYLLRSTNTGISAVITNKGKVLKSIENNERGTISGIALAGFNTSIYSRHGDLAILMLIFFTIFLKLIGINNKHE